MSGKAPPRLSGPGYRRKVPMPPGAAPAAGFRRRLAWIAGAAVLLPALGGLFSYRYWTGPPAAPQAQQVEVAPAPAAPPAVAMAGTEELLQGRATDWRVHRLRENQALLVIEFPDLAAQGRALNRVAALVEKSGSARDRVLSEAEMARLLAKSGDSVASFYQGHDYSGAALARFFNLTRDMPLNTDELRLQRRLIDAGLLLQSDGQWLAPDQQAVITFSGEQADDPLTPADEQIDALRRASVLRHELSHGEYFTNPVYREHCRRFWRQHLSETERAVWRRFLKAQGYDDGDEDLMINETQAYLMHTPDTRAFGARDLGVGEAVLARWRLRFRQDEPVTHLRGAVH